MNKRGLESLLQQVGTIQVKARRKCALCGKPGVELAIRQPDGTVTVYHWGCLRRTIGKRENNVHLR